MERFDGFHLPGFSLEGAVFDELFFGDEVAVRVPRLTPAHIRTITRTLIEARERTLADAPVERVVAAIDRVAKRIADPDDAIRRTAAAALPAVTGYHSSMVTLVLDRMAADWQADALRETLRAELGGEAALERFVERSPGVRARAFGPRLAVHIFAGNVPGVAVTSIVRSLLVRAATLGKTASGEPVLAPLFAHALADVWPELGACLGTTYWPGGERQLENAAFAAADAVVLYGGQRAAEDVRARVPPGVRLIEHGPRVSFAAIAREALADNARAHDVAAACARAIATFDQQGCVSPHVVYVERGGGVDGAAFAERLASALAALESTLPRGRVTAAEAAAIHDARATAEFRAIGGRNIVVHSGPGTSHTVIYDAEPAFEPSCLNRVVRVKPVDRLEDLPGLLVPVRALLQSAGLAVPESRLEALAALLAAAGVTRVSSLERLPWPPASGHHDGRGPLRELVCWTDLEA